MVTSKFFTISLVILICKITEAFRLNPFKIYSVGVEGGITCRYPNKRNALIIISSNSRATIEKRFIARNIAYPGVQFHLSGSIKRIFKPSLYVKIIHTCTRHKYPFFVRVVVKRIPSCFVRIRQRLRYYNLGKIELSKQYGTVINLRSINIVRKRI